MLAIPHVWLFEASRYGLIFTLAWVIQDIFYHTSLVVESNDGSNSNTSSSSLAAPPSAIASSSSTTSGSKSSGLASARNNDPDTDFPIVGMRNPPRASMASAAQTTTPSAAPPNGELTIDTDAAEVTQTGSYDSEYMVSEDDDHDMDAAAAAPASQVPFAQQPARRGIRIRRRRLRARTLSVGDAAFDEALDGFVRKHPGASRSDASRFLVARKGLLEPALDMYAKHLQWRAENMPVRLKRVAAAVGTACIFYHGRALDDTPVIYFKNAFYDRAKATPEEYALVAAACLEVCLARAAAEGRPSEAVTLLVHTSDEPGAVNAMIDNALVSAVSQVRKSSQSRRRASISYFRMKLIILC